jgi:glycosyltransferase involved in cell wall biosynthesis
MNGAPFLVEAIREHSYPNLHFTFIGDGVRRPVIEAAAADGLCQFIDGVPYAEMPMHLNQAQFLVLPRLPTIEADLFIPTKLLEAMGAGLVVLGSDVGGIAEVITDGVDGLLFRAGDVGALHQGLAKLGRLSPIEYSSLSEAARAKVCKKYKWRQQHGALANLYDDLVNAQTRLRRPPRKVPGEEGRGK